MTENDRPPDDSPGAPFVARRVTETEEALGRLLAALPEPPEGWVEAAASLPQTRRDADRIIELVEEDREFRQKVLSDLEAALREAGYEPSPPLLAQIRARLDED